jgi:hypothetical protein
MRGLLAVGMTLMSFSFLPAGLMTLTLAWGLVETVLGVFPGAWVYRE